MKNDLQQILLSAEAIGDRIRELGREIDLHYQGQEILLVILLDGAMVFAADLIRTLTIPLRLDCIRVSSYGDSQNPETAPRILSSLKSEVAGRQVLLVDDILDTGNTMEKITREILSRDPASVRSCVFLDKPGKRQREFGADWYGFRIPDEFVVGYGLDYAGRYRQLPFVATLKPRIHKNQ